LRAIEAQAQSLWDKLKPFDYDAPAEGSWANHDDKYLITFPYPYMNGMLHLGHAFSLSKSEFAAGFQRMKGKRVLWPFGLHATGMPIAACAKKLQNEFSKFGNPPVFPAPESEANTKPVDPKDPAAKSNVGKKGKKAPAGKRQYDIMKEMKIPDIEKFQDPLHWLRVFPSAAIEDLKLFGCRVDWRRSFVTTELNPYYDSFVRWQFQWLRRKDKIAFGKRYTIYSPSDKQPCQDHDRASGEGVLPAEYTIIKIRIVDPEKQPNLAKYAEQIKGRKVILPAATLRPETMVGQTNCWVSPSITYSAFDIDGEVFITTKRSANNIAFQDHVVSESLFDILGKDLIGLPLSAPFAPYPIIYVLPMETVSENKGTGIVTSVPSDSPDDYINLMTLTNKPEYRAKLGLKDEWVLPFPVVPIINIPGSELADRAAEIACKIHGVAGPKDADKLLAAKQQTYKEGFYNGIMLLGPYKGELVHKVKPLMRDNMIKSGDAMAYCEPDGVVTSRTAAEGEECVVALVDQWYLKYGEEKWRDTVLKHVNETMETYNIGVKNGLQETLAWLGDWACSRTFGLGTRLPYDSDSSQYLVDSLSDSTIYMAYYTVAHILHGTAGIDGSKASPEYNISASAMTDGVWDYIFLGKPMPNPCDIPEATMKKMRNEFLYWYPVDLRVSGKDLIQNHLTMALYNHAAIWSEDSSMWPRSFFCNGHILIDKEKMSKSKGNFRTLRDAVEEYSADAARIAIADAGDSLDDPNFVTSNPSAFASKLGTLLDFCEENFKKASTLRAGEMDIFDRIFENEINVAIVKGEEAYAKMQYRQSLHAVFFDLTNARDEWKQCCGSKGLHRDICLRYIDVQCKLLCPITPHVSEYIFQNFVAASPEKPASIQSHGNIWPTAAPIQPVLQLTRKLLQDTLNDIRSQFLKTIKKNPGTNAVKVFAASGYTDWQRKALEVVYATLNLGSDKFLLSGDIAKQFAPVFKADKAISSKMQEALSFLSFVRDNQIEHDIKNLKPQVDDYAVLLSQVAFIAESTGLKFVEVVPRDSVTEGTADFPAAQKSRTAQPSINFATKE